MACTGMDVTAPRVVNFEHKSFRKLYCSLISHLTHFDCPPPHPPSSSPVHSVLAAAAQEFLSPRERKTRLSSHMEMGLCNRLSSNGVGSDQQKGTLKATGSVVCLWVRHRWVMTCEGVQHRGTCSWVGNLNLNCSASIGKQRVVAF